MKDARVVWDYYNLQDGARVVGDYYKIGARVVG